MKQKDVALIVFVSGITAIIAFVVGNLVLGGTDRQTSVQTVERIGSEFILPDERFFNSGSLNPTRTIEIGETNNPDPFAESVPIDAQITPLGGAGGAAQPVSEPVIQ